MQEEINMVTAALNHFRRARSGTCEAVRVTSGGESYKVTHTGAPPQRLQRVFAKCRLTQATGAQLEVQLPTIFGGTRHQHKEMRRHSHHKHLFVLAADQSATFRAGSGEPEIFMQNYYDAVRNWNIVQHEEVSDPSAFQFPL